MQENLRQLAAEVDTSSEEAAKEVTLKGIPMSTAAESAMPSKRRKSIMKHFAHLPPRLQHNSIAKLHLLDGSFLKEVRRCFSEQKTLKLWFKIFKRKGKATYGQMNLPVYGQSLIYIEYFNLTID